MVEKYKRTLKACYIGFIAQAAVVNLAPILFIVFWERFSLSFEELGRLVVVNFASQIAVDIWAVRFADRFRLRHLAATAHGAAFLGLALLGILPSVLPSPYLGLVIASVIYAVGGGLLEVLLSPIVSALPSEGKSSQMSLLHSFYCWGQVGVCLLSTLYIEFFGKDHWFILPFVWALIPLFNFFVFLRVPLPEIRLTDEGKGGLRSFFTSRFFLCAMLLMIAAGASEQVISQWSSLFAERGLGMPKFWGDLLGPVAFAAMMGVGRLLFGIFGKRISLKRALLFCGFLATASYLLIALVKVPVISLMGCMLCGFAVSLMWPGVISLSAEKYPAGGCAMFGLLAVMGDIGCSLGPWLAGLVSDKAAGSDRLLSLLPFAGLTAEQAAIKLGILAAIVFPLLMLFGVLYIGRTRKKSGKKRTENH